MKQNTKNVIRTIGAKFAVFCGTLSNILTVGAIVSSGILFIVQQNYKSIEYKTLLHLVVGIVMILGLAVITYIIYNNGQKASNHATCKLYYYFLHDYRNQITEIKSKYDGIDKLSSEEEQIFGESIKKLLRDILQYLADTMKFALRYDNVSACVKLIDPFDDDSIPIVNHKISTFERNLKSDKKRRALDEDSGKTSVSISQNTAFSYFFNGSKNNDHSIFYQGDLPAYAKKMKEVGEEYKNTTTNWSEYYKGTIVAPLRVRTQKLEPFRTDLCKEDYTIVGFLCVDTKEARIISDDDNAREFNTDIIKSYAALIFEIMQYYKITLKRSHNTTEQSLESDSSEN